MGSIPKSWVFTPLTSLYYLPTGVKEYSGLKPYFSTGSIKENIFTSEGNYDYKNRPSRANRISVTGDILQARMKATNKVLYIDESLNDSLFSTGFFQLRPSEATLDSKYLLHYFSSYEFLTNKDDNCTGATQQSLNDTNAKKILIPLAPLNEQKRIAQKLNELLATVESIKTRLDNAPTIIKRFRQSILAAATSGKLTEEWREENGFSEEWKERKLEEICNSISDGDHQAPPKAVNGIPFLVISNIRDGKINFDTVSRWVPVEYYNNLKDIRKAQRNDILYTVTGSYGIPVIVDTDENFCFQRHIAIIKSDYKQVDTKFLYFLLGSSQIIEQAHQVATGTAQKTVPLKGLRNFKIFLPLQAEQKEIVSQVESLFALADKLEEKIEAAKKRVDKLTQSILAKAFRGELVEQDPNDESAEKLLERIKLEQGKVKKTRKKTSKG